MLVVILLSLKMIYGQQFSVRPAQCAIKYTTHRYSYTVHAIPRRDSSKLRGRADCPYPVPLYASPGIGVAA